MALILREGAFGDYYGDTFDSSNALTLLQMEQNALYIRDSLVSSGWTVESISAMLGNMETESSINPGRWEGDDVGDLTQGYGLVQWTPATNYINWLPSSADASTMDNNLARINYEEQNNLQWIPTQTYNFSFTDFKNSHDSPYDLALAFITNYERPLDPDQPIRGTQALAWYEYLEGHPYHPTKVKKSHFPWVLYANKLRNNLIK